MRARRLSPINLVRVWELPIASLMEPGFDGTEFVNARETAVTRIL